MIPAAVKKAEADADAAMAEFEKEIGDVKETVDTPTALTDIPVANDSLQTPEEVAEPLAIEEPPVEDPLPVAVEPDYKQKYLSLQGKYNAEIPRLHTEIGSLQGQLRAVVSVPKAEDIADVPTGPAHTRYLKKEEVEDYGEDIIDFQTRMAKGVAEGVMEEKLKPYLSHIAELESIIEGNSEANFWTQVEIQIPDAQNINLSDTVWHGFLGEKEPNSGLTYREIAENAYASNDASRMVNVFKQYFEFVNTSGKPTGLPVMKEKPPVKPGKVASKSVPTTEKPKPTIKESEITAFHEDVVKGKYRGRPEEQQKRKETIDLAFTEGRIVAG